jgi:hypothetical protein
MSIGVLEYALKITRGDSVGPSRLPGVGSGMVPDESSVVYIDTHTPGIRFADRPRARELLTAARTYRDRLGQGIVLVRDIAHLGATAQAIGAALHCLLETGQRIVVWFPEEIAPLDSGTEEGLRRIRMLIQLAPLCIRLRSMYDQANREYWDKHRVTGRIPFGYRRRRNSSNRLVLVKEPREFKVVQLVLKLHERGFGAKKIRKYFIRYGVSPVPSIGTINAIVRREYAQHLAAKVDHQEDQVATPGGEGIVGATGTTREGPGTVLDGSGVVGPPDPDGSGVAKPGGILPIPGGDTEVHDQS